MKDKEVIKALECCSTATCISNNCPYEKIHDIPTCTTKLTRDALDLINRQRADIERLKKGWKADVILTANVKAEAIKEFAEKASKLICDNTYPDFDKDGKAVNIWSAKDGYKQIDNLLKEMVGEN